MDGNMEDPLLLCPKNKYMLNFVFFALWKEYHNILTLSLPYDIQTPEETEIAL